MITSAQYTEGGSILAIIDGDEYSVPDDMENRHRQMLADWEADGNTIAAYVAPPAPIPQIVSRFQARAALYGAGLLPSVETAIAAADPLVQMAWVDAQEFRRDSPTILAMAGALGLTDTQVDELFTAASQIQA